MVKECSAGIEGSRKSVGHLATICCGGHLCRSPASRALVVRARGADHSANHGARRATHAVDRAAHSLTLAWCGASSRVEKGGDRRGQSESGETPARPRGPRRGRDFGRASISVLRSKWTVAPAAQAAHRRAGRAVSSLSPWTATASFIQR
jgi:hypothetical protein